MNLEQLATHSAAAHLSEDDLGEILMGIATTQVSAHTAACLRCAERLQSLRVTFDSSVLPFNHASLAWSQAKANTLTRDLTAYHPRPVLTLAAAWSYAAALAVAASLLLTGGLHHHSLALEAASQPAPATDSAFTRQQEIAGDNAMLAAIDSELYRPIAIPAALYEDSATSSPDGAAARQASN